MSEPENIFQFRLTLTDSFPEIWRRVLVPDECALGPEDKDASAEREGRTSNPPTWTSATSIARWA